MELRELTCIVCPLGCSLRVELEGETVLRVTGNTCPRGEQYAISECTAPVRTLTTTVKTARPGVMLPVKSAAPLPKGKLLDCMAAINAVTATAPAEIGDVILPNVCNTGVDIVATKDLREE